jgi:class III poly(R)-hydroxyalkanoic acid synthase PhaE subunit
MKQWQALSQQSVNAWTEVARDAAAKAGGGSTGGFEQWSRPFGAGAGAGGHGETIERLVDSAKGYVAFMQSLISSASANPSGMASWSDALRSFMPPGGAALFEHPVARMWQQHGGGDNGMGAMAQLFGSMKMPSGDLGELKQWLQLPAFGLMREHQEHQQKSAVAWVEYQEQVARYNAQMLEAARRGFELFEGKLAEREQPGRQIESLRALYDLWVDAAEEGYAEVALSAEFRDVYGALTNAQMRMRSQIQQEIERVSTDLGVPTRSEINSIGERLQALRREVRAQRGGDALIDEIAALRSEFEALKANVGGTRASTTRREPVVAVVVDKPVAKAPAKVAAKAVAKAIVKPVRPPAANDASVAAIAAVPHKKKKKRRAKAARKAERAVAAVAPGNFASRIARFAGASLGAPRSKERPSADKTDGGKGKKKR